MDPAPAPREIYEMFGRVLVSMSDMEHKIDSLVSVAQTVEELREILPKLSSANPPRQYRRRIEKKREMPPSEFREGKFKFDIHVGSHFATVSENGDIKLSHRYSVRHAPWNPAETHEIWLAPGDWSLLVKAGGETRCRARQTKRRTTKAGTTKAAGGERTRDEGDKLVDHPD